MSVMKRRAYCNFVKKNTIPGTNMAADTVLFSTTLLNESKPESLEDSNDAIPEDKPESTKLRNKSALPVPDVNSSRATFTISTPSESESESFLENEDQNWLTCASELSHLVEDLKNASDVVDKVKSDTCPAVETFLVNVVEITQRICKNASKIRKTSSALLKEIEKKKASALIEEEIVVSVPCHDPAERCKVSSLTEKKYLVKLGSHQPKLSVFPQHEDIPPRKQCRFSAVWYSSFPHLEYSISKNAAFCYVCLLFPSGPGREHADAAWPTDGMRQWHKMTSRGTKKKGKLAEHFGSNSHKAALADFYSFSQESSNVDLLLDKEKRSKSVQAEKDKMTNKDAVFILLARTLARQGIAFRSRTTDSTRKQNEEGGNFNRIVRLVSTVGIVQALTDGSTRLVCDHTKLHI